jgi:hypothetical protein
MIFNGGYMKTTKIITAIFLLIISVGLTSCAYKFPQTASKNEGILIIPHKATNQMASQDFAYYYYLEYTPETIVKIKMVPDTTKDFFIIPNFPVGKYMGKQLVSIGASDSRVRAHDARVVRPLYGYLPFEIKPGEVTIFNYSFDVVKKGEVSFSSQYWKINPLNKDSKTNIVQKLKKLKNVELWTLPQL